MVAISKDTITYDQQKYLNDIIENQYEDYVSLKKDLSKNLSVHYAMFDEKDFQELYHADAEEFYIKTRIYTESKHGLFKELTVDKYAHLLEHKDTLLTELYIAMLNIESSMSFDTKRALKSFVGSL